MFDLYFKQEIFGEKILLYKSSIRKQYKYILENNERFCTEARMHHKIDLNYNVRCFNEALIQGQYQSDGYTKNIKKVFLENPIGFYKYFQEILERKTKGITIKKRMYVIKQYILFTYLSKKSISINTIEELINKILVIMLYIPGIYKSRKFLKEYNNRSQ